MRRLFDLCKRREERRGVCEADKASERKRSVFFSVEMGVVPGCGECSSATLTTTASTDSKRVQTTDSTDSTDSTRVQTTKMLQDAGRE